MKRRLLSALLLTLAVAACNPHSAHTVDWYVKNSAERVKRVPECRNDAAQMATPDCLNAVEADAQAFLGLGRGHDHDHTAPRITP